MTIMMTMMQIFANAWFAIGWEPVWSFCARKRKLDLSTRGQNARPGFGPEASCLWRQRLCRASLPRDAAPPQGFSSFAFRACVQVASCSCTQFSVGLAPRRTRCMFACRPSWLRRVVTCTLRSISAVARPRAARTSKSLVAFGCRPCISAAPPLSCVKLLYYIRIPLSCVGSCSRFSLLCSSSTPARVQCGFGAISRGRHSWAANTCNCGIAMDDQPARACQCVPYRRGLSPLASTAPLCNRAALCVPGTRYMASR